MTATRMPAFYIPHGGGPWPFLDPGSSMRTGWRGLEVWLQGLRAVLPGKPEAIVVATAHWEEKVPTVTMGASTELLFDYYGFPENTYSLSYPAPGSPAVASRVLELLLGNGIPGASTEERGLDHGVFVPLMVMYPEAEIPVVALSLQAGLDPRAHLAIGEALIPLRDEGVLLLGSGLSYHNMAAFRTRDPRAPHDSKAFDDWLTRALDVADPEERASLLAGWERAPRALMSHPRSEHLTPVFVAAGAAGADRGVRTLRDSFWGISMSGFQFG